MTPPYLLLGYILGLTSSSSHLCKDTGCQANFANQGVEAHCVNVLHANWTEIGEKYNLSTAMEHGLCDGACCRCFKLQKHDCTDVTGSCKAAFGGKGSCIDARTGDLSNIDTLVKPKGGLCGASTDQCCECFKLKTEDVTTTISTTTTTTTTTSTTTTAEIVIRGSLMAIGGWNGTKLRSAEVVNTSCDFPLPEYRHSALSVTTTDGKILVCSGNTPSRASCLQFDYHSKVWKQHSSLRNKFRGAGIMVELRNGLYVAGGGCTTCMRSSEFLAKGSSMWTQGPDVPGYGVYYSCAAKLSDTEFVILGGMKDGRQARVYNEQSSSWREWPRLIVSVRGQSCIGLGDIVLMAGGYSSGYTGRTVIFDSKTGSAREVASLKYPRYHAAMQLYKGRPVILGGVGSIGSGRSVWWNDGEIWNMDTETWEEADLQLNIGRTQFSLVTIPEITLTDCK